MRTRTFLLPIFMLCAATIANAAPQKSRFAAPKFHFSCAVPKGWQQKKDIGPEWTAFLAPQDHNFRTNFTVHYTEKSPTDLKDAQKFFAQTRKEFAGKGAVRDTQKITLGGKPALSYRVLFHNKGLPDTDIHQIFCVSGGHLFMYTFTTLAVTGQKYAPIDKQVVASFKFDK